MAIPSALIDACEKNEFVWHRESRTEVAKAFDELGLTKGGQFFEFSKKYCLQFVSETLPFELVDFVEEGEISDNVFYARDELGIDPELLPISPYEAESIYAVDVTNDSVLFLTPDDDGEDWNKEIISNDFYQFMLEHLK